MIKGNLKYTIIGVVLLIVIISSIILYIFISDYSSEISTAPDFKTEDLDGVNFSLDDFKGEVIILHITNIENPLCIECEKELRAQTQELVKLKEKRNDTVIITINMRKNPYSDNGRSLAEKWWNINITWHWFEDFDPYPIAGKYIDYWNLNGATVNPTIILIDKDKQIVGVYHVYQMGKGEIDGIQDAEGLGNKIDRLNKGEWEDFEGDISKNSISFIGMFGLGIITSLSPCSIALLVAMLSYVMSSREKSTKESAKKEFGRDGFVIGTGFTLGMAFVFFIIGLFISSVGDLVRASSFFYLIAGILMILLGFNNLKSLGEIFSPIFSKFFIGSGSRKYEKTGTKLTTKERMINFSAGIFRHSVFLGGFILGIFFALAWAPCAVSLVFPVIIWMLSRDISLIVGALMLFDRPLMRLNRAILSSGLGKRARAAFTTIWVEPIIGKVIPRGRKKRSISR